MIAPQAEAVVVAGAAGAIPAGKKILRFRSQAEFPMCCGPDKIGPHEHLKKRFGSYTGRCVSVVRISGRTARAWLSNPSLREASVKAQWPEHRPRGIARNAARRLPHRSSPY